MSRHIDRAPLPASPREKQVIVLSLGRNGTMGLYHALQMLGYQPYHMKNLVLEGGVPHLQFFSEAMRAKHWGEGNIYRKEEFEKWMGDFDALIDIPGLFVEEMVEAYPDAQFILTTRDPMAWIRSVRGTLLTATKNMNNFPLRYILLLSKFTRTLSSTVSLIGGVVTKGRSEDDDEGLIEFYNAHNDRVRKLVPPEKLLVVKLEDGLGWEQICPFLGKEIPDEPYPRGNDPGQFHKLVNGTILAATTSSLMKATVFLAPIVAFGVWYYMNIPAQP